MTEQCRAQYTDKEAATSGEQFCKRVLLRYLTVLCWAVGNISTEQDIEQHSDEKAKL